jgi:hypothetical protein
MNPANIHASNIAHLSKNAPLGQIPSIPTAPAISSNAGWVQVGTYQQVTPAVSIGAGIGGTTRGNNFVGGAGIRFHF